VNRVHIVVCDQIKRRAIALVYDETKHHAPVILTKRVEEDALKIVTVAETYGITVICDDGLSAALYDLCGNNRVIPETLFAPIAEMLAKVIKQGGEKKIQNLKLYEDTIMLEPDLHERLRTLNVELTNIEKKIMKTATRLDNTLLNEIDRDIDEIIDYELEVTIDCYDADEMDYPLCTLVEYLKGSSKKDDDERWGIDDGENHNEFEFRQDHPMYGEYHCWLFHCLYDHKYLTWEEIAAIQYFWVNIKPCYQYRFDTPEDRSDY
jgi:type III secretion system FlhB-like substrate exporter